MPLPSLEEEPRAEQKGPRKHINQRQQIFSTKALLGLTLIHLFLEKIIMFREKKSFDLLELHTEIYIDEMQC